MYLTSNLSQSSSAVVIERYTLNNPTLSVLRMCSLQIAHYQKTNLFFCPWGLARVVVRFPSTIMMSVQVPAMINCSQLSLELRVGLEARPSESSEVDAREQTHCEGNRAGYVCVSSRQGKSIANRRPHSPPARLSDRFEIQTWTKTCADYAEQYVARTSAITSLGGQGRLP